MQPSYFDRHPRLKDAFNFGLFILLVFIGTLIINTFVFRSFSVLGHSMDNTLANGERLIVNRLPITAAQLSNKQYFPERGEIIVFKNPRYIPGSPDEYIVKRVIAYPGERVTVDNGVLTVYNAEHPTGYQPDDEWRKDGVGPQSPTSGEGVDITVPDGTVFVSGDNRIGNNSYDSRSGLGTVPTFDIVGPVSFRIFPFTKMTSF